MSDVPYIFCIQVLPSVSVPLLSAFDLPATASRVLIMLRVTFKNDSEQSGRISTRALPLSYHFVEAKSITYYL